MSHQVETMMYDGRLPWHGLGNPVKNCRNVQEGLTISGTDWLVGLEPLQLADGRGVPAFATVRKSDNRILGVVGPKYHVLQNREAFEWFQPFLDSELCTLHTAGSLDGGRKVWVLAHISGTKQDIVDGDRVDAFVLLSNSHDGTMAVRVGFTPVRVVCANTLHMSHHSADSKLIRLRHTRGLKESLVNVREIMDLAKSEFVATCEQYRKLATTTINQADVRKYVRLVLDIDDKLPLDEIHTRTRNVLFGIEQLAQKGTGTNIPGVKDTLWGAYNAVTEYLSYGRGKDREKRLDSLWFGSSADLNKKAFDLALSMAS